jgi:uncharacterized integral membrane protein
MAEIERSSVVPRRRPAGPLIAVGVLGVALGAFIVQNTDDTRIEWLFWDGSQPLWLVLLITSVIGAALARLVTALIRRARDD